jgi:hypothetical protein
MKFAMSIVRPVQDMHCARKRKLQVVTGVGQRREAVRIRRITARASRPSRARSDRGGGADRRANVRAGSSEILPASSWLSSRRSSL